MFIDTKEPISPVDLSHATIEGLSYLLRHKKLWPKNFHWNYACCNACAMGLAHEYWPNEVTWPNSREMCKVFGISEQLVAYLFLSPALCLKYNDNPPPKVVADLIDLHLAKERIAA